MYLAEQHTPVSVPLGRNYLLTRRVSRLFQGKFFVKLYFFQVKLLGTWVENWPRDAHSCQSVTFRKGKIKKL